MVSLVAFIGIILTLVLALVGPVLAAFLYIIKNKGKGVWKALVLGAAGFYILQYQIRITVLNTLATSNWFQQFAENNYITYCLILASTAALVEVVARFVVAKCLQKELSYQHGIAAGLGHGGIEAVLLVGMTYVNNAVFAILVNTGLYDMLVQQVGASSWLAEDTPEVTELLVLMKEIILETPACDFYLAGYERILCILFHISMSLLICYTVYKKKTVLGVGIAFTAHFLVDFVSAVVNGLATPYLGNVISEGMAYVMIYGFLTLVAVGSVVLIQKIGKQWKAEEENG